MFSKESVYENPETFDLFALNNIVQYTGPILSAKDDGCPFQSSVICLERTTEKYQLYQVKLHNLCFLYCTEDTYFYTPEMAVINVLDLKPFDKVMCLDQNLNTVASIKKEMADYVYTLKTLQGNAFLNNILVKTT